MILPAIFFTLLSIFGTFELLLLTMGALLATQKSSISNFANPMFFKKIAVLIPAFNEEMGISYTLESLKKCSGQFDIYVIADNCTDCTAKIARNHEVKVIERTDPINRGKDFALKYAFDQLLRDYDVFVVVDADSVVSVNFIEQIQSEFNQNIDALQIYFGVLNDDEQLSLRLMKIAYLASNWLRPSGRNFWGFSCGIFGDGFAVSKKTLIDVPFHVNSIVEDLNYHLALIKAGKFVKFSSGAKVLAEMPITKKGRANQRAKWEKGRLHSAILQIPKLLPFLFQGNWRVLEPILDLMTLPLSYHTLALLILLIIPIPFTQIIAMTSIAVLVIHVLVSLKIGKANFKDYLALLAAPMYVLWKITLVSKIINKDLLDKNRAQRRNEN